MTAAVLTLAVTVTILAGMVAWQATRLRDLEDQVHRHYHNILTLTQILELHINGPPMPLRHSEEE